MITIYFTDRRLIISKDINLSEYDISNALIRGDESLSEFVNKFENLPHKEPGIIYSDNPEEMLNEISNIFRVIIAAGGLVENVEGDVLIIERLGKYDLPKGKLDKGESALEGAKREISEECGINNLIWLKNLNPTYHTYHLGNDFVLKKSVWFHFSYKGSESLHPQLEENITDVRWVKQKDLHFLGSNIYPAITDVLNQVFNKDIME